MVSPRITMQDVARTAGVHQTTVSLALRNDPRLPETTRRRLREVARKLGYRPDPVLNALNSYRSVKWAVKPVATMAFFLDLQDRRELAASYPHRQFLEGARLHAEQIGYRLEVFFVGPAGEAGEAGGGRAERVLAARGITGVILGAFTGPAGKIRMNWGDFSAVLIESQQLGLPLHTVSNDQARVTREAVRRLHALGYRRIGLAVGEREENYLRNAFTAGYYVEVAQFAELARLPPCLLPFAEPVRAADRLEAWVREHGVDAIMSNWHYVPEALRGRGWRVPQEVVVASLDLTPARGANAGMRQNHRVVGERAVEQLAILLKTNQRGPVDSPNLTLIHGAWLNGTHVPRRRPGVHQ